MAARISVRLPRLAAVVLACLLAHGPAVAQVQGLPVHPADVTVRPAGGVPAAPARRVSLLPPVALPASGVIPASVRGEPLAPDLIPGPPPPECQPAAPPPSCGDPFRYQTRAGGALTGLPRTLLWEPPLAGKREPRFQVLPTTLSDAVTSNTVDTSIGGTLGLLRAEPAGRRAVVQFDAFALVNSRFSEFNFHVDSDFRFGFPVTFARGPWHGKIGYEHTSSHLGDETAARTGRLAFDYIKDELVAGLGRWLFDDRARVYGQAGWAFSQNVPGSPSPFRFDLGGEWGGRRATGCLGRPFAAVNVGFDGAADYDPNLTVQLGWLWRDPTRRLGQFRAFGEYYTGHSPFGQFFQTRESWFGIGTAFDY